MAAEALAAEGHDGVLRPVCISPEAFVRDHLLANRPALLDPACTGIDEWAARRQWATTDGRVDIAALRALCEALGDPEVPVERTLHGTGPEADERCTETARLSSYLRDWASGTLACCSGAGAGTTGARTSTAYLKDWHYARAAAARGLPLAYAVPPHFADDWLNPWAEAAADDFRFAYLGPAGSGTAVHHDVLRSCSWSANVAGVKQWVLWPPGSEAPLRAGREALLEHVWDDQSWRLPDAQHAAVLAARRSALHAVQRPGQAMFVPAGWYHAVRNATDCVSINHNWCNAADIQGVAAFVAGRAAEVRAALADVRPGAGPAAFDDGPAWRAHCATVLRLDAGTDLEGLKRLLRVGKERGRAGLCYVPAEASAARVGAAQATLRSARRADAEAGGGSGPESPGLAGTAPRDVGAPLAAVEVLVGGCHLDDDDGSMVEPGTGLAAEPAGDDSEQPSPSVRTST
mmetsp:Transcript_7612/g.25906  ORF Transcript_7612/g.25906 Transcript_7612/m.25906 type:complete len:461 (-) Transcript_7612:115-1497(-)|eukprot:CAMPEP_0206028954 /NCGR_PEP_ID=MMETSP1464-20131121/45885_1 /ASSEMBLY_ACC=CAM_ASM_001124 /TAXON_ID=119497 /ORGANISM="Exanthemachrysis gayraliae, Strain RCC1523" /LENGTH=460 /DNA_ID=CAMNT_0053403025 /DNA_START=43 /DNA_END=1422 /DNA_ORIENTATION=-